MEHKGREETPDVDRIEMPATSVPIREGELVCRLVAMTDVKMFRINMPR